MAQSGFTPIQLYFSTTAAAVPLAANLAQGELAINITDGKLYYENNSGTVTLLASAAGASGDVVGPASATDNALARFDGTTGKLIQNGVVIVGDTGAVTGVTDLTASGNVTLSGGTANGVAYLNGSKVVTSGSALTFDGTNLGVGGIYSGYGANYPTIQAKGTLGGIFRSSDGTGTTVSLFYSSSGNYLTLGTETNHPVQFLVNNSEAMRLTSTGLGIGTSSIGEKLVVSGSASVDVYKLRSNTSAPASTDAFIYRPADNTIGFGTGSAEKMRLDSSGNLGLGVTPSAWGSGYKAIDVASIGASFAGSNYASYVTSNAYNNAPNWIYKAGTYGAAYYNQFNGAHAWYSAPAGTAGNAITFTQAMTLDASGNLLVGRSSGTGARIDVYNSGSGDATIRVGNAQNGFTNSFGKQGGTAYGANAIGDGFVYSDSSLSIMADNGTGVIKFSAGGNTERARIDSSGNLLVGTTTSSTANSVTARVSINNSTDSALLYLKGQDSTKSSVVAVEAPGQWVAYMAGCGNSSSGWKGIPAGTFGLTVDSSAIPMVFATNSTERARIDSSGNLLFAATSAHNFGSIPSIQAGGSNANGLISVRRDVTSTADQIIFYNPNGLVGRIETTGSATSYTTSSDYRLKNTIAPMTGALAKVALLKPCTYKWNADGSDGEGFIAHELAEVVPQCVTGAKDAVDEEGNPKYQGIDTSFLVATLTAAIQEQQAIIESLKARLDAANL